MKALKPFGIGRDLLLSKPCSCCMDRLCDRCSDAADMLDSGEALAKTVDAFRQGNTRQDYANMISALYNFQGGK